RVDVSLRIGQLPDWDDAPLDPAVPRRHDGLLRGHVTLREPDGSGFTRYLDHVHLGDPVGLHELLRHLHGGTRLRFRRSALGCPGKKLPDAFKNYIATPHRTGSRRLASTRAGRVCADWNTW